MEKNEEIEKLDENIKIDANCTSNVKVESIGNMNMIESMSKETYSEKPLINETTILEIINLLFENMKETTNKLNIISRKNLLDLSFSHLETLVKIGVEILSDTIKNVSSSIANDWLEMYVDFFIEMLDLLKKTSLLKKEPLVILSSFIVTNIKTMVEFKSTSNKEMQKQKSFEIKATIITRLLIKLGELCFNEIIAEILAMFLPGTIPKLYVVELLIKLALSYMNKVPFGYSEVISRILPALSSIKQEGEKVEFCKLFSTVSESIITCMENEESIRSKEFNQAVDRMSPLMGTLFDLINAQWLNSNFSKNSNKNEVIKCLILLGSLIPENSIYSNFNIVAEIFINNINRRENFEENYLICKSFRMYFDTVLSNNKESKENIVSSIKAKLSDYVNNILQTSFSLLSNPQISPNIKDFDSNYLKLKNEILLIIWHIISSYQSKALDYLLTKFDSSSNVEKITNIYILKSIIIRIKEIGENQRDQLIASMTKIFFDTDLEIKFSMIDLSHILIQKDFLNKEKIIKVINFLINESRYLDDVINKFKENSEYPFVTNLKIIRDKAEYTLNEIFQNSNKVIESLWPNIIEYLLEEKYNGSTFIICKIVTIIKNYFDNQNISLTLDSSSNNYTSQLILRFFILLSDSYKRSNLTTNLIAAFRILLPILNKDFSKIKIEMNDLENFVKKSKFINESSFVEILISNFDKLLSEIKINLDVLNNLIEVLLSSINNLSIEKDKDKICLLIRFQGILLNHSDKKEFIKNQLQAILNICHPEIKNEFIDGNADSSTPHIKLQNALSEAYGLVAKSKLDLVLDKINFIFQAEIQYTKPTGFSALFLSNKDPTLSEEIINTLIMCLGKVAKYADINELKSKINSNFLSYFDKYYNNELSSQSLKMSCLNSYGLVFKSMHKLSSSYIGNGDCFILHQRDLYLDNMTKLYITKEASISVKVEALNNIGFLIQLDPPISLQKTLSLINLGFSILNLKEFISSEEMDTSISNKLKEAMKNIFSSVLIHDSHLSNPGEKVFYTNLISILNKNDQNKSSEIQKDKENDVQNQIHNEFIDYNKDNLNSWLCLSYISEYILKLYNELNSIINSKNGSEESRISKKQAIAIKSNLLEIIEEFYNTKKSMKIQEKDDMNSWSISFLTILYISIDSQTQTKDTNNHHINLNICLSRLLTSINKFDFDYNSNETDIINSISSIILTLERKDVLFLSSLIFKLIKMSFNDNLISKFTSLLINIQNGNNDIFKFHQVKILKNESEKILQLLLDSMESQESVEGKSFQSLLNFADIYCKYNLDEFLGACLEEKYGLPLPTSITLILHKISKDFSKLKKIFSFITEIMNNEDPGSENRPNYKVCASTVILGSILESGLDPNSNCYEKIVKFFPELLSTLILRIGSAHSINYTYDAFKNKENDPRNQAVWTLQQLVKYSKFSEISSCLQTGGSIQQKLMDVNEYDEGVYELMMICCQKLDYESQSTMFDFLENFKDRPWAGQRIVVISCFAQFLFFASEIRCKKDFDVKEFRNNLVNKISSYSVITDSEEMIRKMSIRGLANLTKVYLECVNDLDLYCKIQNVQIEEDDKNSFKLKLKQNILDSTYDSTLNYIIEKINDTSETVVIESLTSLNHMVEYLSLNVLNTSNIGVLLKLLRPCFDSGNSLTRSLSFNLFSSLINIIKIELGKNSNLVQFVTEQIHNNYISMILHSNDEAQSVRKSSMKCLFNANNFILDQTLEDEYNKLKTKFIVKNIPEENDIVFEEYMIVISDVIFKKFPKKIPYHIQNLINHSLSTQENIRGSSVVLLGLFYSLSLNSKDEEIVKHINIEQIFSNFIKLLKDYSCKVKVKTINAFKYFKEINNK